MNQIEKLNLNIKTVVVILLTFISFVSSFVWFQFSLQDQGRQIVSLKEEIKTLSDYQKLQYRVQLLENDIKEFDKFGYDMLLFKINTNNEIKNIQKQLE